MAARLERTGSHGRFRLVGELDFATVPEIARTGERYFRGCPQLSVDLSGVTRSDSAGLALLIEWARQAKRRSQSLNYVDTPAQMRELVRVSDLDRVLPFARTDAASPRI